MVLESDRTMFGIPERSLSTGETGFPCLDPLAGYLFQGSGTTCIYVFIQDVETYTNCF
jgi:hypothetical protein